MRNYFRLLLLGSTVFFYSQIVYSQTRTQSGTLEYNGAKYPCEIVDYDIPPDDVETIIRDKMRASGQSPEESKGFLVYRNVQLHDLGMEKAHDFIFKIERKSRKEKDKSTVSIVTALPGEIPKEKVKGGGKGLALITPSTKVGLFFTSMHPAVKQQAHNLNVLAKTEEIEKAEKKMEKLKKEQANLEKKIKSYQDDLQANQKSQVAQATEIEALKTALDELKGIPHEKKVIPETTTPVQEKKESNQ